LRSTESHIERESRSRVRDRRRLGDEIADVFVLLAAIAEKFDIDIEQAVAEKFFQKDGLREWKSAIE
jgi:NTP pyrophosphatase (non-canonical NTP hydrolase)